MSDYVTLRTRIADELANDGAVTDAQIAYAVQDAIKMYERRMWWWNQNYTSAFTTVANQEFYTSSDWAALSNTIQIDSMTVTYDSVKSPLRAVDALSIDDEQDGSVVGVPTVFAYYTQSIRFYAIPDDAYAITVSYVNKLTALSADADTNAWTTEAEELIRHAAKRKIAMNYMHAPDVADRVAPLEKEAFDALMAENRRRQPNTILRSPAMLDRKRFNIITG